MATNRQSAIENIYGHFILDRKRPAYDCYVNPDSGDRCAVGCLFSDDLAQRIAAVPAMNQGLGIFRLLNSPPPMNPITHGLIEDDLAGLDVPFLTYLQNINDGTVADVANGRHPDFHTLFEQRLRVLAATLGLTLPPAEPCAPLPAEVQETERLALA